MKIGQKFRVQPAFCTTEKNGVGKQWGTITWIHPEGRFALLEFEGIHGKPRECFSLFELLKKK